MCRHRPNFDMFRTARISCLSGKGNVWIARGQVPRVEQVTFTGMAVTERKCGGGVLARRRSDMATDNAIASLVLICASLIIATAFSGSLLN